VKILTPGLLKQHAKAKAEKEANPEIGQGAPPDIIDKVKACDAGPLTGGMSP